MIFLKILMKKKKIAKVSLRSETTYALLAMNISSQSECSMTKTRMPFVIGAGPMLYR